MSENKKNKDFYEDAGDALSGFRRKHRGGALPLKDGKDPFDNDPDMIQSRRQDKLAEDQNNMYLGY